MFGAGTKMHTGKQSCRRENPAAGPFSAPRSSHRRIETLTLTLSLTSSSPHPVMVPSLLIPSHRSSPVTEPDCFIQAHEGAAYDVKSHENGEDSLLFSCGDDGHIRGWRWKEMTAVTGAHLDPVVDLANPQHKGPWGSLSPITEINAIALDNQETGKVKVVYKGHSDYLHSVVVCNSSNQVLTGSEDGTTRIWDSRSGKGIRVLSMEKNDKLKDTPCVSSLALDASENWLACGSGRSLSIWNLVASE